MKKISIAVILALILIAQACQSSDQPAEKKEKLEMKKSLNPNGDSELALLMRGMYEEAERIKAQVKAGEEVTLELDHAKILTAHATEPEKADSKEFKDFANMYLANLEQLQKADPDNVEMVFQSLVESCMSCHQELCPGPMVRIKKLRIAKAEQFK